MEVRAVQPDEDRVAARAAVDRRPRAGQGVDDVVTRPGPHAVGAPAAQADLVVAGAADEDVGALAALQEVVAGAAVHRVAAAAAVDDVVASPAGEAVGGAHPAVGVQAIAPDDVVARPAGDDVRAMGAQQRVVALGAGLAGAAGRPYPGDPGRGVGHRCGLDHVLAALEGAGAQALRVGDAARLVVGVQDQRVVARAAIDPVDGGPVVDVDDVVAVAGADVVGPRVGVDHVVARAGVDLVGAGAGVDEVVAVAAGDGVGRRAAVEEIVAGAAGEPVVAEAAVLAVAAVAALEAVVAGVADELVVAALAAQQVGAGAAVEPIGPQAAGEVIGALEPVEHPALRRVHAQAVGPGHAEHRLAGGRDRSRQRAAPAAGRRRRARREAASCRAPRAGRPRRRARRRTSARHETATARRAARSTPAVVGARHDALNRGGRLP